MVLFSFLLALQLTFGCFCVLDIEVQKMKKAVESLMAANEEKVPECSLDSHLFMQLNLCLLQRINKMGAQIMALIKW